MTTFAYVAMDPSGKKSSGFLEATTKEAAINSLTHDGRFVVEIREEEQKARSTGGIPFSGSRRVTKSDLALFTRRMADLSAAGLPLDRVLQVVAEQSESQTLAHIAEEALTEIRSGTPVSQALAMHPKTFPAVFTQTLAAGEASGQFPEVATKLAEFQENEVARRSQIISALIYPIVLTVFSVFVVIFLLTFVMPKLVGVFHDLGGDLPASTKLLLAVTNFLTQDWAYIIGGIALVIALYRAWAATAQGALQRDSMLLRLPVVGVTLTKATVSRFARVLGTLVFGGVPILDSLKLAGMASGNRMFMLSANQVQEEVREGKPIAQAMRDAGAFPPVLTHMVAIGEETGDLPKMLGRVSDSLDFEVDNGLRRLTSLVEPIIILGMGAIVGFVVLSVLLPIFQAQELVK